MAATPNVKSPPRKHAYPLCPLLITMDAIYIVAIRSRFLHIADRPSDLDLRHLRRKTHQRTTPAASSFLTNGPILMD